MAKKLVFDRMLFTTVALLVGFGLVMVFSASVAQARDLGEETNPFLLKQGVAAVIGLGLMAVLMHLDYRHLARPVVVYGLLGTVLVALGAVLFGPEINGTHRWFRFGGFSFQPSEVAKVALVLFLAHQIHRKIGKLDHPHFLVPCGAVTVLLAGLLLLQPDLGTAVLLAGTAFLLVFLAGLPWRYVVGVGLAFIPLLWTLVISVPYRRQRLLSFLDPESDPLGAGFQVHQSLIAVGSGGAFGLGPGNSVQKLYFLPHPHSDFIFAIIAEELGLVGGLAVVSLFGVFLWRGLMAGWRAPDTFGRFLGWGLTIVVVFQALINLSVALALLPTKGIPLPFISYGGSSLLVAMAATGILLNVSQHA